MVVPRFATDTRSDSVFWASSQTRKKPVVFLYYHAHVQTNQTCFPVKTHVLHTPSSVQCQLNDKYHSHWLAEAFLSSSVTQSLVIQLSDSACCDEEGSVDIQRRACLLPGKRHTHPSRGEQGVLNYICLQLRMCCGCNVTQTNNGWENVRQKNRVGDDVWRHPSLLQHLQHSEGWSRHL